MACVCLQTCSQVTISRYSFAKPSFAAIECTNSVLPSGCESDSDAYYPALKTVYACPCSSTSHLKVRFSRCGFSRMQEACQTWQRHPLYLRVSMARGGAGHFFCTTHRTSTISMYPLPCTQCQHNDLHIVPSHGTHTQFKSP